MLGKKHSQDNKPVKSVDKKVRSFFMLAFPTVLIIVLALTTDCWWALILLAFYQFVLLKQFIDAYYKLEDLEES